MKPPPLLLGAALLFWGWQAEYLIVGAVLGVILESARFLKVRWEFSDEDFTRIWVFCSVLVLAAVVYAFTDNEGPANFANFFQNPSGAAQTSAGTSTARTASDMLRRLPMIFFLFIAAQTFSTREAIPFAVISLILRRRWKKAKERGERVAPGPNLHIGYPYFALCLVGASGHPAGSETFFWGLCGLLTWALWAQRSRRFGLIVWAGTLLAVIALGYAGQRGIFRMQDFLENLNPQWLAHLRFNRSGSDPSQSRTALGRVGELKLSPRIVVRLEPLGSSAPPTYLREASYRIYKTPTWYAGSSRDDYQPVTEQTPPENSGIWLLIPGKTNPDAVRIASYLEDRKGNDRAGLLPLPGGSGRLENLPAFSLEKNSAGAVLATGPGLVIFDARYGPGVTMDAPGDTNEDLTVPDGEAAALDEVIIRLGLKDESPPEVMRALSVFFENQFTYRTWQEGGRGAGTNDTPLGRFLLENRAGHCEYFATATTLLLRRLHIPARYAVGYAVHEQSGRKYVVRLSDAHAWCLVWDEPTRQWRDFDTTPATWVETEAQRASAWRWLSDAWSRLRFEWSKIWWGQTRLRQYILWGLVPVLALLLYQIIFRRGRRRRPGKKPGREAAPVWPGLDSEFYLLERALAERGVARQSGEPLAAWLERALAAPELAALSDPLRQLLRLHYRYRFDPLGLSAPERVEFSRAAKKCLARLG